MSWSPKHVGRVHLLHAHLIDAKGSGSRRSDLRTWLETDKATKMLLPVPFP